MIIIIIIVIIIMIIVIIIIIVVIIIGFLVNPQTKNLDFRGFDSGVFFISGGGILMSIANFPEVLSQRILGRDNLSREIGRTQPSLAAEPCGDLRLHFSRSKAQRVKDQVCGQPANWESLS